nr:MAG TPA: hypothetical protein [Caudoviricetes sp.]
MAYYEESLIKVTVYDKINKRSFTRGYNTVTAAQNFLYKLRYSKKLTLVSVSSYSRAAMEEIRI